MTVNNFTPIGSIGNNVFNGIFDGCGHTISGIIVVNDGSISSVGLFGFLGKGAAVKNVTVIDSEFINNMKSSVAAIVGDNYGTVNNCHNRNTKINSSGFESGGIVGVNNGLVVNCSSTGDVISTGNYDLVYTGGVVGRNEGTIYNSCNIGNVNSVRGMTGGITGGSLIGYLTQIQNCYNVGVVTSDNNKNGGIVGKAMGIVANCYCSEESASVNFCEMNGTERNCKALPIAEMQTTSFMNQLNSNRGDNEEWQEWEICLEESMYHLPTKEPPTEDEIIKYGDINGDGAINVGDGVILKKHLAGMPVEINQAASDVNVDGNINITDAVLLMKYLAGVKVEFGVAQ